MKVTGKEVLGGQGDGPEVEEGGPAGGGFEFFVNIPLAEYDEALGIGDGAETNMSDDEVMEEADSAAQTDESGAIESAKNVLVEVGATDDEVAQLSIDAEFDKIEDDAAFWGVTVTGPSAITKRLEPLVRQLFSSAL